MPELGIEELLANRYRISHFVDEGAFGEVYRARDTRLNVEVAVKILKRSTRLRARAREEFLQEAQRQALLRGHPHVVQVHDVDETERDGEPFPFCIMEWLPGGSLEERIPQGQPADWERVRTWLGQVADALDAAAGLDLVHRDVKPLNILLDGRGRARLGDFGIAKVLEASAALVSRDRGTLQFMAPEQYRIGCRITPAADLFALGVTLWLLVTGEVPLPYGGSMLLVPGQRAPRLASRWPECPPELDELAARMLAGDPVDRPSAAEVRDALLAVPASPAPPPPSRWTDAGERAPLPEGASLALGSPRLRHSGAITAFGLSEDGRRLASGGEDGRVRVWDLWTGRELRSFASPEGTPRSVTLTANGEQVLARTSRRQVVVWDVESGAEIRRFRVPGAERCFAAGADGRRAVTVCGANMQALSVWDLHAGKETARLEGHSGALQALALSPDGRLALTGGREPDLRLWDLEASRELRRLSGHTERIKGGAFSPEGRYALSGSWDGTLRLWEVETGRELRSIPTPAHTFDALALSPNGRHAVGGDADGTCRVWELETGREVYRLHGYTGPVAAVSVTPDGRYAVAAGTGPCLQVWNLDSGAPLHRLPGHAGAITALAALDSRRVLSAAGDGTLRLWSVESGRQLECWHGEGASVSALAITPGGGWVACAEADGALRFRDLASGTCLGEFEERLAPVYALACSGNRVFTAGETDLRVWELDSGAEEARLAGHLGAVRAIAVLSPQRLLTAGEDRALRLWDLAAHRTAGLLTGHAGTVLCLAVTPDGRRAVSGSADHTVRVWDLESGTQFASLAGPTAAVTGVGVTPDGRYAVSVGEDGFLRGWDLATLAPVVALPNCSIPTCVTLDPGGQWVLTGNRDATLTLYSLPALFHSR